MKYELNIPRAVLLETANVKALDINHAFMKAELPEHRF